MAAAVLFTNISAVVDLLCCPSRVGVSPTVWVSHCAPAKGQ